ncbi:MAG: MraY family glycosyltransferase [Cyanobacteria bacterium P01_D01_bin.105]
MTIYWIYITICLLAAIVALFTIPLIKDAALRFKKLDAPSERKMHQQPMVRLGGVAICFATLFAIASSFFLFDLSAAFEEIPVAINSPIVPLLVGSVGFFLIGFADDLFDLSALHRLWLQGAIAAALWAFGLRVDVVFFPGIEPFSLGWLGLPITVIWLTGVVNAINWIDGLDGLAAGISAIVAAVVIVLSIATAQPMVALISSALLGSLLGFLVYNYNPAEIFMGDGGSYFLGFMLASLSGISVQSVESSSASLLPLLILAIPIGDMTSVIAARLFQKRSPFSADNLHLHHRLLAFGLPYRTVVWVMYVLTFATGAFALATAGVAGPLTVTAGGAVLVGFFLWQLIVKISGQLVSQSQGSNVVVRKTTWYSENL